MMGKSAPTSAAKTNKLKSTFVKTFILFRTMPGINSKDVQYSRATKGHYHVIFDRPVDWAENMRGVDWAAIISHNDGYVSGLQCNASNVRQLYEFSERDPNRRQRVIYNHGSQKWQIEQYFEF